MYSPKFNLFLYLQKSSFDHGHEGLIRGVGGLVVAGPMLSISVGIDTYPVKGGRVDNVKLGDGTRHTFWQRAGSKKRSPESLQAFERRIQDCAAEAQVGRFRPPYVSMAC